MDMIAFITAARASKARHGALTIAAMAALALFCPRPSGAQSTVGVILGTVADSSGAVISRTTVTVTNTDTGITRSVVSDDREIIKSRACCPARDLGLLKNINITEGTVVQFRSEFFNALNNGNYNQPGRSPGFSFGKILSEHEKREIQFGLRLTF
jgi:hypothetical protein